MGFRTCSLNYFALWFKSQKFPTMLYCFLFLQWSLGFRSAIIYSCCSLSFTKCQTLLNQKEMPGLKDAPHMLGGQAQIPPTPLNFPRLPATKGIISPINTHSTSVMPLWHLTFYPLKCNDSKRQVYLYILYNKHFINNYLINVIKNISNLSF